MRSKASFGSRLRDHKELYLNEPQGPEMLDLDPAGALDGTGTAALSG